MGFHPVLWGPSAWHFLHMVAASYPEEPCEQEMKCAYVFILSLGTMLPCEFCKKHFREMIEEMGMCPNHFQSRESFFKLVWEMHNRVNVRLGKPRLTLDYVKKKYTDLANIVSEK